MIYFYTQLLSKKAIIFIFIFQTLPILIAYITTVKYCLSERTSRISSLLTMLPAFILSAVFNLLIQTYFQEVMVIHNIFIIHCQFVMFFILHTIFERDDRKNRLRLLIVTILSISAAGIFEYIRIFLLNFADNPIFSIYIINWYFLGFLVLLPLVRKFLVWIDDFYLGSPKNSLLFAWGTLVFLDLFHIFLQVSSVTEAIGDIGYNLVIFLSADYIGIPFVKWLAPSALYIIEPVSRLFPFGTAVIAGATILVGAFFFLMFLNNYNRQKIAQQEQLKYELTQYVHTLENMTTNIRKNHHDFSNILFSLGGFIYQSPVNEEALKKYYESVTRTFEEDYHYFLEISKLKNLAIPELKTLIFTKLMTATRKEIPFDIEIEQSIQHLPLDELSLSRIFGILIDNALEAAGESSNPYLRLALMEDEEHYVFILVNSTKHEKVHERMGEENFSTKGEHRGLGLSIVRAILQKHKNTIWLKTTQKDSEFCQTLTFKKETNYGH